MTGTGADASKRPRVRGGLARRGRAQRDGRHRRRPFPNYSFRHQIFTGRDWTAKHGYASVAAANDEVAYLVCDARKHPDLDRDPPPPPPSAALLLDIAGDPAMRLNGRSPI
jgi:hypothetical protein